MCDNCGCETTEENIFLPKEAKIIKAVQATADVKLFTLKMADRHIHWDPGQFLEVSLFGYGEIPIGFASSPTRPESFDIAIRTVGRVSGAINKLVAGDSMFLRAPLGTGFPINLLRGQDVIIVAGGIGLCPTRSLIQYIMDRRDEFKKFTLIYGAKNPSQQMFKDELATWKKSSDIDFYDIVDKADENWKGEVGLITSLFAKTNLNPETRAVICGPPIMFKFVVMELNKRGIKNENIFLDLERRMKCGVGKCGHCQINDQYVCVDGPVFPLSKAKQLEEAL